MSDRLLKFLFRQAPVRAEIVRLEQSWQQMTALRNYPPPVLRLLGEATAAATLLAATIKFPGSLILQIHGDGPVRLLVVECQPDLGFRATAKLRDDAQVADAAGWRELVNAGGQGRCAITLDPGRNAAAGHQRYQGIVPLQGDSVAEALEAYLQQSEQIDSRLWLAAGPASASGMLLQKLPYTAGAGPDPDEDAWRRATMLAQTLTADEMLRDSPDLIAHRLFWQEQTGSLAAMEPRFACTCSRGRTGRMLIQLGRPEVDSIVEEQGSVSVTCDFCNALYAFDPIDVRQLFATGQAGTEGGRPH